MCSLMANLSKLRSLGQILRRQRHQQLPSPSIHHLETSMCLSKGPEEVVMEDGLGVEVDSVGGGGGKGAVGEGGEGMAVRKFQLKIWMRTWTSTTEQQWRPAKWFWH